MISWIGTQFDNTIAGYSGTVATQIMVFVAPIALAWLTAWVSLYGYKVLSGGVCDPLPEFLQSFITKVVIVGVATTFAIYHEWVIDLSRALTLDVAKQFALASSPMRNATTTWGLIEAFNDRASDLTALTVTDGVFSTYFWVAMLAVIFFSVGNAVLIAAAMLVSFATGGFNAFVLGIGPIFVMFLLGEFSRQWFVNWLGTCLGLAVLTWLLFFLLGFSMGLTEQIVATIVPKLGQINVLTQAILYAALCLVWALMLWVAPSFVNGLTGGAALQMGVQMLTQLHMAMKRMGGKPAAPNTGANTATRSQGWGYRAGSAVGALTGVQYAFQALAARGRAR